MGGRREISADGVHISPIDVLMKLQQKPEWADVSISLLHRAIAAAPKLMCRGERMAEWHTKRLVDAEQQQAVANASLLLSCGCSLEDLRAHRRSWILHGMCRCSRVHVADDSLDGSIIDWAVEGGYFSCDRFGSRVHRLWTVNYSSGATSTSSAIVIGAPAAPQTHASRMACSRRLESARFACGSSAQAALDATLVPSLLPPKGAAHKSPRCKTSRATMRRKQP